MLIYVNKTIYAVLLLLLVLVFTIFLKELAHFNKKSDLYARQNLFHAIIDFNIDKFYFLDGYSHFLDVQTIPYCELSPNISLTTVRKIAYRYPNSLTISKYWSFANKQNSMLSDATQLRHAYAMLANTKEQAFQTKKCVNN